MDNKIRLDIFLTSFCNIQSRNKARELIEDKKIKIDNKIITKPSFKVSKNNKIEILEDDFYVSRSAKKLKFFLEEISIDLTNQIALDIGSSTGGFTQILLQNNVKNVYCVDVGTNQLHEKIKNNPKINMYENTDIRDFISSTTFDIITCDVSFISILNILNDINRLATNKIIILYKPQFEVGNNVKRDSKGVVTDKKAIKLARDKFLQKTATFNWKLEYSNLSQIRGKNGNQEELFYFVVN